MKTSVPNAPSLPHLVDERVPTNPSLWQAVLDVAQGKKREYTSGGRTIHAPNEGRGFYPWPHPQGSAWAVKQYNGFGGGWRGRKESDEDIMSGHERTANFREKLRNYLFEAHEPVYTEKDCPLRGDEELSRKLAAKGEPPALSPQQERALHLLKTGAVLTTGVSGDEYDTLKGLADRGLVVSVGSNPKKGLQYWEIA